MYQIQKLSKIEQQQNIKISNTKDDVEENIESSEYENEAIFGYRFKEVCSIFKFL